MAKFLSQVYTWISGRVGGIVYHTSPGGAMVARAGTFPTQPVGPLPTAIHNAFTLAASDWAGLTDQEQLDWQAWVVAHGAGTSGRGVMMGAKAFLHYAAATLPVAPVIDGFDKAPTFTDTPAITAIVGDPSVPGTGVGVKVENPGTVDVYAMVEFSVPFGVSRRFWKGPWQTTQNQGGAIAAGASALFDQFAGNVGNRIFCRVRAVTNDATGGQQGHVCTAAIVTHGLVATTV